MPADSPDRASRASVARTTACALALGAALALFAGVGVSAHAATAIEARGSSEAESTEYRVKAAMLLKFARYATWPAESFDGDKAPIVVLVVGDDPFGDVLEETFEGQRLRGRSFVVRRSKTVPAQVGAHVVFSKVDDAKLRQLLIARCERRAILLVGDEPGYATSGALMNFAFVGSHVRFEINKDVLEASPLSLSSELLKLARIVKTERREDPSGEGRGRERGRSDREEVRR